MIRLFDSIDVREQFWPVCAALSLGLNLALIASRNDDWPTIQVTPYGAEANELLDKGFRIFDETGAEVEYFDARGFHHRYDDPAPVALIHECAA